MIKYWLLYTDRITSCLALNNCADLKLLSIWTKFSFKTYCNKINSYTGDHWISLQNFNNDCLKKSTHLSFKFTSNQQILYLYLEIFFIFVL